MIDEKKLIEEIHKYFRDRIDEDESEFIDNKWLKLNKEVCGIIYKQPKIEKCGDCSRRDFYQKGYEDGFVAGGFPLWNPVGERPPRCNGVYFVTKKIIVGNRVYYLPDMAYFDGQSEWYNDNRVNHSRVLEKGVIVAWQPLPEPYREEE